MSVVVQFLVPAVSEVFVVSAALLLAAGQLASASRYGSGNPQDGQHSTT